ncbi:NlpC/P60 family protein [Streptomyces sp. RTd22]|uniref:aggregation-promoting factor C-terminal-like domain-containing protein n=1 Tax=Streptomyces sp. RTd22 TaxID=1841249 RepID=UPI0007C542EE|nr:NlpC/P60 family protein [Streptomyces sp. RTd22]
MAEDNEINRGEPTFGGRLLGTNGMQRAADKVASDIGKLGANITALNRALQGAINSATRGAAFRGLPAQAFPAANQTTRINPAPISHPPANTVTQTGGVFTHPTTGRVYTGPLADRLAARHQAQMDATRSIGASRAARQEAFTQRILNAQPTWGGHGDAVSGHLSASRAAADAREAARQARAQMRAQMQQQAAQTRAQRQQSVYQQGLDAQQAWASTYGAQASQQYTQNMSASQAAAQARAAARQARHQRRTPGINPDLMARMTPDRVAQARQANADAYYGSLFDEAIRRQDAADHTTWGLRAGQRMWAYNRATGLSSAYVAGSGFYASRNGTVFNLGGGNSGGRGRGGGGSSGNGSSVPPPGGFGATVPAGESQNAAAMVASQKAADFKGPLGAVYGQAVKYGDRMRPQMEEMDRYTNWAYIASGGAPNSYDKWGWKNQIRDHSYGMVVAKSTEDASNANFLLDKNFGLTYGTSAQAAVRGRAFGASYVAGLDAETGAKLYSGVYNPQASLAAQRLGYGRTIGAGGKAAGIGTLADSIMKRTFGTTSISSKKFAAATASGQALDYNIDQLGQASGWDAETVDNLKEYMRGRNTLLKNSGMTSGSADELIAQAAQTGSKGDAARKKLTKYGVSESLGQTRKTFEAQERQHDAVMGDSFAHNLETATKAVQKFEAAINGFLELPGVKQIVGASGAWATATKGPINKIKSLWNLGKSLLPINIGGGAGGATASSSSSGEKSSSATAGHVANGNASSAIQAALGQVGVPYVWGAEDPKHGFDCSGLTSWAYRQAGINLPRTSQQQMKVGVEVDKQHIQPGDLLFPEPGHVMMAIGSGKLVEAPRTGLDVRVRSFTLGEIKEVRRVASGVGALSSYNTDTKQTDDEAGAGNAGWYGGSGSSIGQNEIDALTAALARGSGYSMGPRTSGTGESTNAESSTAVSSAPSNPKGNVALGKKLAAQRGWTGKEWDALFQLWEHESNWNHKAKNPSSGAYGIAQSLPAEKMASKGKDWRTNPATQIEWGLDYIAGRPDYGKPSKAWELWQKRNPHWYASGAWEIPQDLDARVHKGEMIIPAAKAETIRQALIKDSVNVVSPAGASAASGGVGTGGGVSLSFAQGAIQINVNGSMSDRAASDAAKKVVDYIAADNRIKQLGVGV